MIQMNGSGIILVTGGEGFIGRQVRRVLLAAGKDLISIDHKSVGQSHDGVSYECDLSDAQRLQKIFTSASYPVSAIAHLASTLRTASEQDPKRATEVNILGSLNVFEAARQFKVGRVVFASSVSIYGSKPAASEITEADYTAPEDMYGAAKKYIEVLGNAYSRNYGIQFVTLRIPIVVGSGPGTSTSAWRTDLVNALAERREREILIPFRGNETLSIVHVEDLANALTMLLNAPVVSHSVYNAPCEIWRLSDLKKEVESLNPQVHVSFGDKDVNGFPRRLNSDRFRTEFDYVPDLSMHLRRAAHRRAKDKRTVPS
jgi:nucleoside-diphosphate-sugar epimerase